MIEEEPNIPKRLRNIPFEVSQYISTLTFPSLTSTSVDKGTNAK